MKIINWSKLAGERFTISGASLIFTSAIESNDIYYVSIIDADGLQTIFDVSLKELNNHEIRLSITANQSHFGAGLNGINEIIGKSKLKNINVFVNFIITKLENDKLFSIYLQLIDTIQNTKIQNKKAVPVNPLNFHQPSSQSIQW